MSKKPIEIGCLAMLVSADKNTHLLGVVGKVVRFIPANTESIVGVITYKPSKHAQWVLETSPISWNSTKSEKYTTTLTPFPDKFLIRIDGDVPEETECDEISKVKENV